MFMDYKQQTQFEFFPKVIDDQSRPQFQLALKDLTLSPERIIVISIFAVMVIIFSFALGLEKGKKIASSSLNQEGIGTRAKLTEVPAQGPLRQKAAAKVLLEKTISNPAQTVPLKSVAPQPSVVKPSYTIQVASFKSSQNAYEEAKTLEKKGYQTLVLPKGSYSIVCVGKFVEEAQAKQFVNKLKNQYRDCMIRRL